MLRNGFSPFLTGATIAGIALLISPHAFSARKPVLDGFEPQAIAVVSRPITLDSSDPDRTRFGELEWRGGVQLSAASPVFGGWSGLALNPGGSGFVVVSDAGLWFSGAFSYRDGSIAGVSDLRAGPLLGRDGRPIESADDRDAEAITWARDRRTLFVAYENRHRIERVPFEKGGLIAPIETRMLPGAARAADPNMGIEAAALLTRGPAAGWLIALSERNLDGHGNHRGWLIGRSGARGIALERLKGFDVTDAAVGPEGDLYVLERRFRYEEGIQMRIRRVAAAGIRAGALLRGEVLFEADGRLGIDNMEGIAAHRGAGGETILTLISDDNFNRFLQRTIVLQFAVAREERVSAQP